jgi:hypothetical protein
MNHTATRLTRAPSDPFASSDQILQTRRFHAVTTTSAAGTASFTVATLTALFTPTLVTGSHIRFIKLAFYAPATAGSQITVTDKLFNTDGMIATDYGTQNSQRPCVSYRPTYADTLSWYAITSTQSVADVAIGPTPSVELVLIITAQVRS